MSVLPRCTWTGEESAVLLLSGSPCLLWVGAKGFRRPEHERPRQGRRAAPRGLCNADSHAGPGPAERVGAGGGRERALPMSGYVGGLKREHLGE